MLELLRVGRSTWFNIHNRKKGAALQGEKGDTQPAFGSFDHPDTDNLNAHATWRFLQHRCDLSASPLPPLHTNGTRPLVGLTEPDI